MEWVTLALCGLLLTIAAVRTVTPSRNRTVGAWAFLQLAVLLSLAKLARTPHIADRYLGHPLQRWTGLSNLMTLTGMTLGSLTAVPAVILMASLLQYRPRILPWIAAQVAVASGMIASFLLSPIPRSADSSYITASVPTPWPPFLWVYWAIFLGTIGVAATVNLVLANRALAVFAKVPTLERNVPFRLTLYGWALTGGCADLYVLNKLINLYLTNVDRTAGWYMRHVETTSLVLLLAVVASAALALLVQPACLLPQRINRFMRLYRDVENWREAREANPNFALPGVDVPTTRIASLWRASGNLVVAASLRIELADAVSAATYSRTDPVKFTSDKRGPAR